MSEHSETSTETGQGVPIIRLQFNLPGYDILGKAGEGGMGVVWRAKQQSLDREVAIKVLRGEFASEPDEVADFLREARALAALKHPGLVPVYDVGQHEGAFYFVMEFINGGNVGTRIRRNRKLGQKQALTIAAEVAEVLLYARDTANIIHRDIKPDNIMLGHDGAVRVTDLGLASIVGANPPAAATKGDTVELAGTPNYIAPEQAQGAHDIDFHADMYALGATLYHMVTGQIPFADMTPNDALTAQITQTIPNPRSIDPAITPACAALIRRLMMKSPSDRYTSWKACVKDLRKAVDGKLVIVADKGNSTIDPPPANAPAGTAAAAKRALKANADHRPVNSAARLFLGLALICWWGWLGFKLFDLPPKPQLDRRAPRTQAPQATPPPTTGTPRPVGRPSRRPDTITRPEATQSTTATDYFDEPIRGLTDNDIAALGASVVKEIFAQETDRADALLAEVAAQAAPGQLDALRQLTRTAAQVDQTTVDAFRQTMGKPSTLNYNGRKLTIVVKAIRNKQIAADMLVGSGSSMQKRPISFSIDQVDPAEQCRWVSASTPEAAVTRSLLMIRGGDYMGAQQHAAESGPMREVLSAGIDERIRLITE